MARKALWWKARHPNVPLRCTKRDVSRAFKWHRLQHADVPEFAASLDGTPLELKARALCFNLVMPFGWLGSPGEFVIMACAAKKIHACHCSAEAARDDPSCFSSDWLMDDGVLVEPLVGARPWASTQCLEDCMHLCW